MEGYNVGNSRIEQKFCNETKHKFYFSYSPNIKNRKPKRDKLLNWIN